VDAAVLAIINERAAVWKAASAVYPGYDTYQQRAFSLLVSKKSKQAFDVTLEP